MSHDRYFINKTATRILDLTNGKLLNYIGNYDYYLEKRDDMMAAHFGADGFGGNAGAGKKGGAAEFGSAKSGAFGNAGAVSGGSFAGNAAGNAGTGPSGSAASGIPGGSWNGSVSPWASAAAPGLTQESGGKLDWKAQKEEQARQRKRQNDLKKVEEEIHTLETRDGEIDGLLCKEEIFTDVAKLMELNKEKDSIAERLEVLYEKWEELAE